MTTAQERRFRLIWATRGRSWGFRFLLDAGLRDPLSQYEHAFTGFLDEPATWHYTPGLSALRFPDPLGRRDTAGRVIPHDFVVLGDMADTFASFEDAQQHVWPLVAEAYARVWDRERPPSRADLGLSTT